MKIAALSPQFLIETPAGEEKTAAEKASAELRLELVRPRKPDAAAKPDPSAAELAEETRDGLKRLSRLIRRKKETKSDSSARDAKRRRALAVYSRVADGGDPRGELGSQLDEVA